MTESLSETSKLTVEHLLPQGWTQAGWPLPNPSVEATEARNEFIGLIAEPYVSDEATQFEYGQPLLEDQTGRVGPIQHARPQQGSA